MNDAARFQRVMSLFDEACRLDGLARASYLDLHCESMTIREEVDALLAHDARTGDDTITGIGAGARILAAEIARRDPLHGTKRQTGLLAGQYRILRLIGEGGMGEVYEAEQARPRRIVALKAIRPGLASREVLRRFEHEVHILGRLHHPGIAQIYEAGAADADLADQAFFVMEYVKGLPLNEHASLHNLSERARLDVMVKVCDAVQHAHQRGVIHRDLKPSNILVDESGQPKILDFGVAIMAGHDPLLTTMHTLSGQWVGTLAYMSPEQVASDSADIDTRADVYALGVLTYQLLAERLPHDFRKRPLPEAARIIREVSPPRLGTLNRSCRGDIETIVAKAMEKDRDRRYQSAADLAADIRRYLTGEPIIAKHDSALYVLRKQLNRYRGAVAAACAFVIGLVLFSTYATIQAQKNLRLAENEREAKRTAENEAQRADHEAQALRESLYFNRIGYAQAAYLADDIGRMQRLLADCPEDQRAWEWHYLARQADESERVIVPYEVGQPVAASFSPKTGRIATCSATGTIKIWERFATSPSTVGDPSLTNVRSVLSPDGSLLLAIPLQGQAEVRDAANLTLRFELPVKGNSIVVAHFSPDGRTLFASFNDAPPALYDLQSAERTAQWPPVESMITCAAYSPDGRRIAAGDVNGGVMMFSIPGGEVLWKSTGHERDVRGVAFNPDGLSFASVANDSKLRLWNAHTGEPLGVLEPHSNKINCVAYKPDDGMIATGSSDNTIKLIDPRTQRVVRTLHGHGFSVLSLALTSDGSHLLSTSRDGTMRWWNLSERELPSTLVVTPQSATSMTISPDGKSIVAATDDGTIVVFDQRTRQRINTLSTGDTAIRGLSFSPDGRSLVFGGASGEIQVWDTSAWTRSRSLVGHGKNVEATAFSRDGAKLATAGWDGSIRIWDFTRGEQVAVLPGHDGETLAVEWMPDDEQLVSGGTDGIVRLWNANTGECAMTLNGHAGGIWEVVVRPATNQVWTAGEDATIRAWDFDKPDEAPRVVQGHNGPVYCLAFNADGSRLVSGGFDNLVKLWEPDSGQEILTLRGHIFAVTSVRFSPDNTWIASSNDDGTVRLWIGGEHARPQVQFPP